MPFFQQRDAEKNGQNICAFPRTEHQQRSGNRNQESKGQDHPPHADAKAFSIDCDLDLEQHVGKDRDPHGDKDKRDPPKAIQQGDDSKTAEMILSRQNTKLENTLIIWE